MPEQFKPYNFDQAQTADAKALAGRDEATKMSASAETPADKEAKIKSGEAKDYKEAEEKVEEEEKEKNKEQKLLTEEEAVEQLKKVNTVYGEFCHEFIDNNSLAAKRIAYLYQRHLEIVPIIFNQGIVDGYGNFMSKSLEIFSRPEVVNLIIDLEDNMLGSEACLISRIGEFVIHYRGDEKEKDKFLNEYLSLIKLYKDALIVIESAGRDMAGIKDMQKINFYNNQIVIDELKSAYEKDTYFYSGFKKIALDKPSENKLMDFLDMATDKLSQKINGATEAIDYVEILEQIDTMRNVDIDPDLSGFHNYRGIFNKLQKEGLITQEVEDKFSKRCIKMADMLKKKLEDKILSVIGKDEFLKLMAVLQVEMKCLISENYRNSHEGNSDYIEEEIKKYNEKTLTDCLRRMGESLRYEFGIIYRFKLVQLKKQYL